MANRQTSWARPQIHSKGIHTCILQSINRYLCYLRTNVWLLLHAGNESSAQQKNKPNQVAELDTGQGTRDERWDARCGMREGSPAVDPSDIQSVPWSVRLAGELPAFAYVSCDFWRLYDFSALYTKSCLQFLFSLVCFLFWVLFLLLLPLAQRATERGNCRRVA